MRTLDTINLEKAYGLVFESRAAGTESQQAGENAKSLAIEKTLIKAITEDLNATAAHLETIQPLLGTFEQGHEGEDFQGLMNAMQAVQTAVGNLQSRMSSGSEETTEDMPPEKFPEEAPGF